MTPTEEQVAVVDAVEAGGALKVKAYAGAGKTSTLKLAAQALGRSRGLYMAFNKDIAAEAARKFPTNTRCRTAHSVARAATRPEISRKIDNPLEPSHHLAVRYGLGPLKLPTTIGKDLELSGSKVARMVADGVARFCRSAQPEPLAWHIPVESIVPDDEAELLRASLLPFVKRLWQEYIDPAAAGAITHDVYLKLWQLSRPRIGADFILFDEAQDADGLMLSVLRAQQCQVIYVGDPYQQIYEWRGAVNAMDFIKAPERALTESFRFGPAIAQMASRMLSLMDEDTPVRGQDHIASRIEHDSEFGQHRYNAILCRKNATVLTHLAQGRGRSAARDATMGSGSQDRNPGRVRRVAGAALPHFRRHTPWPPDWRARISWADPVWRQCRAAPEHAAVFHVRRDLRTPAGVVWRRPCRHWQGRSALHRRAAR